jgi:DNA-directed RNA polymerase specialized sigma24 family protein
MNVSPWRNNGRRLSRKYDSLVYEYEVEGLTQQQLADKYGVNRSSIYKALHRRNAVCRERGGWNRKEI